MDYQVYSEDELETLEVIKSYGKASKAGKIVSADIIPIQHKPSAERLLMEKVKLQEDEYDPEYSVEDSSFDFSSSSYYHEVVGKHRMHMEVV